MLKSNEYNGQLIEWIDKPRGVFKVLRPDIVANHWGYKKSRRIGMKWANLARGIRFFNFIFTTIQY